MSENKLKIGITQGDTNGVGWEVILKTFADPRMTELCTPVVYGSKRAADFYRDTLVDTEPVAFHQVASASEARRGRVNFVPAGDQEVAVEPGVATPAAAHAAADALRAAAADLREGLIDALVTAPIDKQSIQCDEFRFTGHTEFLASELGGEPMMMMCSDLLRVALVTIHIPVAEVSSCITQERIVNCLGRLRETLRQDFGIVEPRMAVLALNPHAGDGGLLGREEQTVIKPAVESAFRERMLAYGPFAADGFFASGAYAKYDAVLAMYHDQGLAPFKTLSPEGVNFTACLSRVRTSPDHGVAFDIAGRDKADPASLRNAVYAAIDIVRNRRAWQVWTRDPLQHYEREKGGRDLSVRDLPDTEKENG